MLRLVGGEAMGQHWHEALRPSTGPIGRMGRGVLLGMRKSGATRTSLQCGRRLRPDLEYAQGGSS